MFFVTAHLGEPHGSAKSARDFARALLATHDNVRIVSPLTEDFGEAVGDCKLSKPIWYRHPRKNNQRPRTWQALRNFIRNRFHRFFISYAMTRQQIIVNGWASFGYWKELGVTNQGQTAIIIRESPRHFEGGDRPEILKEILAGFAEFDRLIFVSDRLREEWGRFEELAEKPAFYLPNCCEEEEVARLRQLDRQEERNRLGMARDDLVLVCPGSIEMRKGQDIILELWPSILANIPNARLIFLGNGVTAWGTQLAEKIDRGAYGPRIIRLPAQPSALEYLYAADALLFPSRAEAMPRTILEAMALGTPVIASSVDGIPEIIEDGISGLLFDSDDKAGMLEKLCWLAKHPDESDQMAMAAGQRYDNLFSRIRQIERVAVLLIWLDIPKAPCSAKPGGPNVGRMKWDRA